MQIFSDCYFFFAPGLFDGARAQTKPGVRIYASRRRASVHKAPPVPSSVRRRANISQALNPPHTHIGRAAVPHTLQPFPHHVSPMVPVRVKSRPRLEHRLLTDPGTPGIWSYSALVCTRHTRETLRLATHSRISHEAGVYTRTNKAARL